MTNFLANNWQAIVAFFAPIITFLTGYKLRKVNLKKSEADALSNVQSVYDTLTAQIKDEVNDLKNDIKELRTDNREQRKSLILLQEDNRKLHAEISKLMTKNNSLKMEVSKLRAENEKLKK